MNESSELVIAAIAAGASLTGAFLGATLQYLFTRRADQQRHRREMVASAYAAYLNAVGEMEAVRGAGRDAVSAAKGRAIAAKARLCVDASTEVVEALSAFEARGSSEMRTTMIEVVRAMRADVEAEGYVSREDVNEILFGSPA